MEQQDVLQGIGRNATAGISLLLVGFSISLLLINQGQFVDEADNLVVGFLMQNGESLYKDLFSHHFPMAYLWVAMVIQLVGKSIFAVRLSILVFQFFSLAAIMRISNAYLPVGITGLIWGLLRVFYKGHMVLYSSIAGICVAVVFCLTLLFLLDVIKFDFKLALFFSVYATIAFLSDPLTVYCLFLSLVFIALKSTRWAVVSATIIFTGVGLYVTYLLLSGSYDSFFEQVIRFNRDVYGKYTPANPLRIKQFVLTVLSGFGLLSGLEFDVNPLQELSANQRQFEAWLFTGVFYRISVIGLAIWLGIKRRFTSMLFVYFFAAGAFIIHQWGFRAQPFILVCLLSFAFLTGNRWRDDATGKTFNRLRTSGLTAMLILGFWLSVRAVSYYVQNDELMNNEHLEYLEYVATGYSDLTRGVDNVLLADYPGGTYSYWFTELEPVAGYVYMWPWTAEVAIDDVLNELKEPGVNAIVSIKAIKVWGKYDTGKYLEPLQTFLDNNFVKLDNDIYVSRSLCETNKLANRCKNPDNFQSTRLMQK